MSLWNYLFLVLAIFHGVAFGDHRALQHRVHHGKYTQPSHVRSERDLGTTDENEVIDEEPNGKIDFSQAVPQKDGSLCVTKVKYMEKLEKTQVNLHKFLKNFCYVVLCKARS